MSLVRKVFVRTQLGEDSLNGGKAGSATISVDEARVMRLIDGKINVGQIAGKLPPSLQPHLGEILSHLVSSRLIAEQYKHMHKPEGVAPSRISREEVRQTLMSSQKLNKDMLLLAEIEIERRLELEQDLSEAREQLLLAQTERDQARTQLAEESARYQMLRKQVLVYRDGMQAKLSGMQAHIENMSASKQSRDSECLALESELRRMREGWQQMQGAIEEKEASINEALRQRMLQEKIAEEEERKRLKIDADEMVRTHPHYNLLRRLSFFRDFRNSDISMFLIYARWREVKAGEIVIAEGRDDCMLYLIVTGKMLLLKDKKMLHVLPAGESFGEFAYMDNERPVLSLSVKARTDCMLLELNPAYLDEADAVFRMRVAEALLRVQDKWLHRAVSMINNLLGVEAREE